MLIFIFTTDHDHKIMTSPQLEQGLDQNHHIILALGICAVDVT